jgi:hypothetical protein
MSNTATSLNNSELGDLPVIGAISGSFCVSHLCGSGVLAHKGSIFQVADVCTGAPTPRLECQGKKQKYRDTSILSESASFAFSGTAAADLSIERIA